MADINIEKLGKGGVKYLWQKITAQGYQTTDQVEAAITAKGYQTEAQVNSAITKALSSYGNGDTEAF